MSLAEDSEDRHHYKKIDHNLTLKPFCLQDKELSTAMLRFPKLGMRTPALPQDASGLNGEDMFTFLSLSPLHTVSCGSHALFELELVLEN